VDHAVSIEEVMTGDGLKKRVCSIPDINAINAFGDCSGHGERSPDFLLLHGREVSCNLNAWVHCFGKWALALV
jgi:hypothetical protein